MKQNHWNTDLYQNKHNFVTKYGEELITMLNPLPNEIILDLGCGQGELTAKIATSNATTIGLDYSYEMITAATQKFPHIQFIQHNAEVKLPFDFQFDAIFSNAALHWMMNQEAVIVNVANSLKTGGRFVFEMGGKGNVAKLLSAIERTRIDYNLADFPLYNYYPSVSEYATLLEKNNFRVVFAAHFDRPTILAGTDGIQNWVKMFRNQILTQLPESSHEKFLNDVATHAKADLYHENQWVADYVRLRMIAIKQ